MATNNDWNVEEMDPKAKAVARARAQRNEMSSENDGDSAKSVVSNLPIFEEQVQDKDREVLEEVVGWGNESSQRQATNDQGNFERKQETESRPPRIEMQIERREVGYEARTVDLHSEVDLHNEHETNQKQESVMSEDFEGMRRSIADVERRATLAISGMDQTVLGVVSKLEESENFSRETLGKVDDVIGDIGLLKDTIGHRFAETERQMSGYVQHFDKLKEIEARLLSLSGQLQKLEHSQSQKPEYEQKLSNVQQELAKRINTIEIQQSKDRQETGEQLERSANAFARLDNQLRSMVGKLEAKFDSSIEHATRGLQSEITEKLKILEKRTSDINSSTQSLGRRILRVEDRTNEAEGRVQLQLEGFEKRIGEIEFTASGQADNSVNEKLAKLSSDVESLAEIKAQSDEGMLVGSDQVENLNSRLDSLEAKISVVNNASEGGDAEALAAVQKLAGAVEERLRSIDENIEANQGSGLNTPDGIEIEKLESIESSLKNLTSDLKDQIKQTKSELREQLHDFRADTHETFEDMRTKFSQLGNRVSGVEEEAIRRSSPLYSSSDASQGGVAMGEVETDPPFGLNKTTALSGQHAEGGGLSPDSGFPSDADAARPEAYQDTRPFSQDPQVSDGSLSPGGHVGGQSRMVVADAGYQEPVGSNDSQTQTPVFDQPVVDATEPSVVGVNNTDQHAWYGEGAPKLSRDHPHDKEPINPIPTAEVNVRTGSDQPTPAFGQASEQPAGLFENNHHATEEGGDGGLRRNALLGVTALVLLAGATYSLRVFNTDSLSPTADPLIATATLPDFSDPAYADFSQENLTTNGDRYVYRSDDGRVDIISSDIGPSNAIGVGRQELGAGQAWPERHPGSNEIDPGNATAGIPRPEGDRTETKERSSAVQIKDLSSVVDQPTTIEEAASSGNAVANYQLGMAKLTRGSQKEAVEHLLEAADSGLAAAQYQVARAFEIGEGVEKNLVEARKWTQKAAEGGNRGAMHNLAVFFAEGGASNKSYARAATWFKKAAEAGLPDSQFNLAILHENGMGVPRDLSQAYYWLLVAAKQGDQAAVARASQISQAIDVSTRQGIEQQASQFSPQDLNREANGVFSVQSWESDRILSSGEIKELQKRLAQAGFDVGGVDGAVGPKTRSAIRAFQRRAGLRPTGSATLSALEALKKIT